MSTASNRILEILGGEKRLNHIAMASHFLHGPTSLRFYLPQRRRYMEIFLQSDGLYRLELSVFKKVKSGTYLKLEDTRDGVIEGDLLEVVDVITDTDPDD